MTFSYNGLPAGFPSKRLLPQGVPDFIKPASAHWHEGEKKNTKKIELTCAQRLIDGAPRTYCDQYARLRADPDVDLANLSKFHTHTILQ